MQIGLRPYPLSGKDILTRAIANTKKMQGKAHKVLGVSLLPQKLLYLIRLSWARIPHRLHVSQSLAQNWCHGRPNSGL
jgi:hypothetical protein